MWARRMWELFSTTLLIEVEVAILKYGSPLHFLKSSVRRRKKSPHARARLASPVGAKGARRLREWSAEIRLFALQDCGLAKINSWYCAAAEASPVRLLTCTSDRTSRSPKPSSLWSCTGRRRIRFLGCAIRAIALNFHNGSSSIQVRRRYVPAYSSSTASSSPSTSHWRLRRRLQHQWIRHRPHSTICVTNDHSYSQQV
jgi:hypothetical protein